MKNGDYDYYNSKVMEKPGREFGIYMKYTTREADKKALIEKIPPKEQIPLASLDRRFSMQDYAIESLVASVIDCEYIFNFLKNEIGMSEQLKTYIIRSRNDPELTKRCIDNSKELKIGNDYAGSLVESLGPSYIRENLKRLIEEHGFESFLISRLLIKADDPALAEEYIINGEKYGFTYDDIESLVKIVENPEDIIKYCVRKYKLESYDKRKLIVELDDPIFAEECIENRNEYGLDKEAIIGVIKSLNNSAFTRRCIENRNSYGLTSENVLGLINSSIRISDLCEFISVNGFTKEIYYSKWKKLFERFDINVLSKLAKKNPMAIEKMVENGKEDLLEKWYKSTGGKFVPHHAVMLNFPEDEIDSFLANGKRWSQLMRIENYSLNDEGKIAILKAAYAMGVFQNDDAGFNMTMRLFTDVPQELTQEEYEKVLALKAVEGIGYDEKTISLFKEAYTKQQDGRYVFSMDRQKNKENVRTIREILEKASIPRILTPEKAHQMFDSFAMEYNPDFVKFFSENIEEILSNPDFIKNIATIQRKFRDIVRTNAGRRLTLDVAIDYIKTIVYTDIEVGNEGVAEQAKIAGYSQEAFEEIQRLFNEGEMRDFSSIPRIKGEVNGYTYEMLRCDDPLALTIGTLTDCCQEINGAGQTSMEHSVVSPDGRVFCVRDSEGRIVAQSWFWRNQYTGCFDNIEIPNRIFALYEKQHPDLGKRGLTTAVLGVYKKAAEELMQEDARVYQGLLESGTITQEQYDALLLGKVTIGLGYNDIADAIQADKTIYQETDRVGVKGTDRLPHPYTDAGTQYTIAKRNGTIKSEHENLYVHQDDVPVFDGTNMTETVLRRMIRMEQSVGRENLTSLSENSTEENIPKSQRIINSIASEYGFDPNYTKVMSTARIAIIYSKESGKIRIGDLFSSPLKNGLTEEQKQKATEHIMYQFKKALKQIGTQGVEVDLSSLSEEQKQMIQSIMQEIENDERGEK